MHDPLIEQYNERYFIGYYGWNNDEITAPDVAITSMYFAITSLSTVGFGDLAPRSDLERAVGAFILLAGVAIFTYIMSSFIEMLNEL